MLGATQAGASGVDLIWSGTSGTGTTGSNSIDAQAGDTLTASVVGTFGATGVSLFAVSVDFNMGDNELSAASCNEVAFQLVGGNPYGPLTPGCVAIVNGSPGRVPTMETSAFSTSTSSGTILIATVVFDVMNPASDGDDLFIGTFNPGVDGIVNGAFGIEVPTGVLLSTASVNAVPEPGTVSLLALGLIGLAVQGRRKNV